MIRILLFVTTLIATSFVNAQSLHFESADTRVALLELYTSEGCSSCPPADKWMSRLKSDPRLWKQMVPVAFHVDYWDYIGWKDRFALPIFSQRQRQYARQGSIRTVYTPGFVLHGEEWREWFRQGRLNLDDAPASGRLAVTMEANKAVATYAPIQQRTALEFHVAVLGFDVATDVQAGENHGRRLNHDFVVLAYGRTMMAKNEVGFTSDFELPPIKFESDTTALAVWVSEQNDPRPLQAAGGWLKP